jgi:hypothetical protein
METFVSVSLVASSISTATAPAEQSAAAMPEKIPDAPPPITAIFGAFSATLVSMAIDNKPIAGHVRNAVIAMPSSSSLNDDARACAAIQFF